MQHARMNSLSCVATSTAWPSEAAKRRDRVALNARVRQGDPIGYASCEGGFSSGTHLHFARRYNGQWIQIDGANPLVLSGFEAFSTGTVYDGYLVNGDQVVEAWYYQNDANRIDR